MFYCNSRKYNVIFVAIPKTGTRTIYQILRGFGGKLFKEHCKIIPETMVNSFSFCITRNPYDRACSMWWSTACRGNDKRKYQHEFKSRGWENNLTNYLKIVKERGTEKHNVTSTQYGFVEKNRIDAFLRFDNLEEDFNNLYFVKTYVKLPQINPTVEIAPNNPNKRPRWQELINEASVKLINNLYAKDFALSGYDMIEDYGKWKAENE